MPCAASAFPLSHTALGVDLCGIAHAVGFAKVTIAADLDVIEAIRPGLSMVEGGPRFVAVRIAQNEVARALPISDGAALKLRLQAHLGPHPG